MIADPSPPPGYTPPDTPAAGTSSSSHNKKRKRGPPPPPQVPGTPEENDVISIRSDLSGRPRLEYARGPTFVPIQDSDLFRTEFIPMNHIGFRYTPAGIHPENHLLPLRTIAYRPPIFRAAFEDRSPYIGISQDGLVLEGCGGFRTARCTAPMREGKWYMEVEVVRGGGDGGAHVRLGWSRRETLLNGPIGLDGYSYAYRDKTGDKVTLARPRAYGRPFKTGDVVGMYISLPPRRPADPSDEHDPAHLQRVRIPIDYKGQEVFEALEYKPVAEMTALMDPHAAAKAAASASKPTKQANDRAPDKRAGRAPGGARAPAAPPSRPLPRLHGAHIAFFVNGECQGVAFEDIFDFLPLRVATNERRGPRRRPPREGQKEHRLNAHDDGTLGYYASVSLYGPARVRLNPGPDFKHPPPDDVDTLLFARHAPLVAAPTTGRVWRAACERYDEFMAEQRELDKKEEIDGAAALAEMQREAAKEAAAAEKKRARREADAARRRAKVSQQARAASSVQPSPLRHATAYAGDEETDTTPAAEDCLPQMDVDLHDPSPFVGQPEYLGSQVSAYAQHTAELAVPTPKVAESAYAAIMSHPREIPYERATSQQTDERTRQAHQDVHMRDAASREEGEQDERRGNTPHSAIQSTPGSPNHSAPGSPVQSTPASPAHSALASPAPYDQGTVDAAHGAHMTENDMPDEYDFHIDRVGEDVNENADEEVDEEEVENGAAEAATAEYEGDEGNDGGTHDEYEEQAGTPDGYSSDSAPSEA